MDRKAFDRVFIIIFENQLADSVLQNPFMKSLATDGVYLYNYHGVSHPSQPNYVASISGSTMGVADDNLHNVQGSSIIDLLEEKTNTFASTIRSFLSTTIEMTPPGLRKSSRQSSSQSTSRTIHCLSIAGIRLTYKMTGILFLLTSNRSVPREV